MKTTNITPRRPGLDRRNARADRSSLGKTIPTHSCSRSTKMTEAIARRDNLSDACSAASDRAQAIKATMPPLPDEPEPPSEFAQIWTHEPGLGSSTCCRPTIR